MERSGLHGRFRTDTPGGSRGRRFALTRPHRDSIFMQDVVDGRGRRRRRAVAHAASRHREAAKIAAITVLVAGLVVACKVVFSDLAGKSRELARTAEALEAEHAELEQGTSTMVAGFEEKKAQFVERLEAAQERVAVAEGDLVALTEKNKQIIQETAGLKKDELAARERAKVLAGDRDKALGEIKSSLEKRLLETGKELAKLAAKRKKAADEVSLLNREIQKLEQAIAVMNNAGVKLPAG